MHPFRAAVEAKDLDTVMGLMADDVAFRSPVVFRPYEGREALRLILGTVFEVFEDFRYTRELSDAGSADYAVVFEARVGDRALQGCDFVHTGAGGLIDELVVMVRPLSGTLALAEAMRARLEPAPRG